jgi:hypothetical protein
LRRWRLAGFLGIGASLLVIVMLPSPWHGRDGGADGTPRVRFEASPAPDSLAPENSVLRSALAVPFAASAHTFSSAEEPELAPPPLDFAAAGVAAGAPPVALSEPPMAVLGLALVAGLRALACRRRAI